MFGLFMTIIILAVVLVYFTLVQIKLVITKAIKYLVQKVPRHKKSKAFKKEVERKWEEEIGEKAKIIGMGIFSIGFYAIFVPGIVSTVGFKTMVLTIIIGAFLSAYGIIKKAKANKSKNSRIAKIKLEILDWVAGFGTATALLGISNLISPTQSTEVGGVIMVIIIGILITFLGSKGKVDIKRK